MAAPGTGKAVMEATGDALGDTIAGAFDIPYQNVIENLEADSVLGGESYETGNLDATPDEPWDPLKGILGD